MPSLLLMIATFGSRWTKYRTGARPHHAMAAAVLATLLVGIPPQARAATSDSRLVYLKLAFNAEGQLVPTSGCFNVKERRYTSTHWWSEPDHPGEQGIEHVLRKVVTAFKNKDREALLQLSEPGSRDPKVFDQQASAFFQQFSVLNVTDIPRSVQVDSLVLFFLTVEYQGKSTSAPLVFKKVGENQFWFLPERSKSLDYTLAWEWFETASKNPEKFDSFYCTSAEIAKTNYRLPVGSDPAVAPGDRSYLYFAGLPLGESASQNETASRAQTAFHTLETSLAGYSGATPLTTLAAVGAKRLKEWWATSDANEHETYISAITTQKPFFVFDLSPLLVMYMRANDGVPRVMYFLPDEHGALLWTNSSYGTTFDRIFKDGPFYNAAKLVPPFKTFLAEK